MDETQTDEKHPASSVQQTGLPATNTSEEHLSNTCGPGLQGMLGTRNQNW
jgi:hypothetical protein